MGLAYFIYFEGGESGQTIGKRLVGIRVVGISTGRSIGYGRATVRQIVAIISTIPCYLGYFWMLWDSERQTWHDIVAGSVVVPTYAYPVQRRP